MASGWVKSLHCKSRAFEDVYHPNPKHLIPSSSCRRSSQSIKDAIKATKKIPKNSNPKQLPRSNSQPEFDSNNPPPRPRRSSSTPSRPVQNPDPLLPALTEFPEGHPSRNVVEIIFHTSWSPKAFTGRIEMIFKVQNGPRTVTRFDEYRETVKARSGSASGGPVSADEENARCVADGNEVMRFHCLGPTSGNCSMNEVWLFSGGKGAAICTYSGSGEAHESAGGGRGRKAMLVCRVIAGRVSKRVGLGYESLLDGQIGYDSVSGDNDNAREDGAVIFRNGKVVLADLIMHCTGYKYHFPFLDTKGIVTVDDNRVGPLYKHVFPPALAPSLSFVGMPWKVIPFPLFEFRSKWIAGILSGRISLPSQKEMMEDIESFYSTLEASGIPKRYTHRMGESQVEYDNWLAAQCGCQGVEKCRKPMRSAASANKFDQIRTMRSGKITTWFWKPMRTSLNTKHQTF